MTKKNLKRVAQVIAELVANGNTTTTLDVKNTLRTKFPLEKWYQSDVSDIMEDFETNGGLLTSTNNGTHKIYAKKQVVAPVVTPQKGIKLLNRTQIVEAIKNSGYKFITVTFIKKDKTERVLNCQVSKNHFTDNLGYIQAQTRDGIKRVDPRTIKSVKIQGELLTVK